MPLGIKDPHYWTPVHNVMEWLTHCVIKPTDFVIDVGCGHRPFARANVGVDRFDRDWLEKIWDRLEVKDRPDTVRCDFAVQPLPFADKSVDFVYCRHTLEDMYDPFLVLSEMERVGKAGYIETPSPVAELTRGADGYANSELWRGYYHHRFFIWVKDETLNFVSKYPLIEHFPYNEKALEDVLLSGPAYWNTYYLWKDEIKAHHMEDPFDYQFANDYQGLLWHAVEASIASTEAFSKMVNEQAKQAA